MTQHMRPCPARMLNVDESGIAQLKYLCRRTLREGVARAHKQLYHREISKKGSLDRATIMGVVSVVGSTYRPAIFFSVKQAWYRFVNAMIRPYTHVSLSATYISAKLQGWTPHFSLTG